MTNLKLNDSGKEVTFLQIRLKVLNFYFGKIDGYFGTELFDSVVNFQVKNNLIADAIVGTQTQSIIEKLIRGKNDNA